MVFCFDGGSGDGVVSVSGVGWAWVWWNAFVAVDVVGLTVSVGVIAVEVGMVLIVRVLRV